MAPALIVRSGFATQKRPGQRESLRVCLQPYGNGMPHAVPAPAGALSGLAASVGLVELAEDLITIRPGDALPYTPQGNMG
ncbi:hypothetical protein ACLBX9_13415 [Methylobacterium sp. A49B]|uniref:hypothetical protein n=1 Tax=Methylobacterium mesophilicum TaxID=39956 RepID=UPI00039C9B47|nr:hypothetical protein [Methylobacterium mesophilicum]